MPLVAFPEKDIKLDVVSMLKAVESPESHNRSEMLKKEGDKRNPCRTSHVRPGTDLTGRPMHTWMVGSSPLCQ